ncbi:serine/threonine protein phosphatase [Bradyrhizobium sp. U87765 SZCCT0131]|uniref:metallophosphoesterase family protein n=1 Tax=unclassified Bradyrhizobium TaxID=2631580 RepID=UPI001BAB760B|nr:MULTISPECIES: metallophosphoesterase family protein [unclassified Bradyrhizobium]MBR1220199.1 serine/threonine protein phosphatase [Bradyrhizobium sp. U87765 SZCCT0131]MBR1263345.1 serine/threonine protein phosphatase [Bradyrhizobium sp. U87765 SZCCT0134]MBR1306772.1 serine/threonine protein phosphatase [Bradyrhizobium sp. U87765 SZCCT0110]MBR1323271.1 serine/threonine protein phosphatase [Bradyrhizobium sp. U87765 SZCCT0109]MBR1345726.1 serine/threonine protein phosphatase [Bradyrhizobium 
MIRSYVIPDLHGRHDLLVGALDAIAARAGDEPVTVITLGDYVDKGPNSRKVIEALIALQAAPPSGWNVICLKGNHDALMRDACRRPETRDVWLAKGGEMALASYDPPEGDGRIPESHVRWLEGLQLMHVDAHRVFVHAGVDPERPLDRQTEQTVLWKRYPDDDGAGHGERHVVHGHDRRRDGPGHFGGRTNLDTQAWTTGRLVVGVFENDRPGGPVDLIEVVGPPFPA